jgi:CheY-like chemotaxis protein
MAALLRSKASLAQDRPSLSGFHYRYGRNFHSCGDDEPGLPFVSTASWQVFGDCARAPAGSRISRLTENLLLVDIRMPDVDGFELISHAQGLQPGTAVYYDGLWYCSDGNSHSQGADGVAQTSIAEELIDAKVVRWLIVSKA